MQQIRRILDMVAGKRLSAGDAAKLLEALSLRLALSRVSWDHFFALLTAGDFSADELSGLLEARTGGRRPKSGLGEVLENLPGHISGLMQHVQQAVAATRNAVPATMLRLEVKVLNGEDVRANLPLALSEHMLKLIPQPALTIMGEHGIDVAALRETLKPTMPPGDILEVKIANGGRIRVWVE